MPVEVSQCGVQTQRSFASRSFDTWDAHVCWNAVSVVTLCSSYTGARVARHANAANATNATDGTNEAMLSAHTLQLSVGYGAVEAW